MKPIQQVVRGVEFCVTLFVSYYLNIKIDWHQILFYLRGVRN